VEWSAIIIFYISAHLPLFSSVPFISIQWAPPLPPFRVNSTVTRGRRRTRCCGARSGLRDSSSVKPGSRESELKREHEPLQQSWPNDDANVINSINNFRFPFRQSLKGDTASFRHPYRDHRSRLFNQLLLQAIQSRKTTISSRVFHTRIAKSSTRLAPPLPKKKLLLLHQ